MPDCSIILTSPPGAGALDLARADAVATEFGAATTILAAREACQLALPDGVESSAALAKTRAEFSGQPIDVNLVVGTVDGLRRKLLVADMESTIIAQECLDELAGYANLRDHIAGITERAMRGELDFEAALRERVGLLKGLSARVLQEIYDERVTLVPGAATLISTMQANGATCALVSGGFTFFSVRVAARLGFDTHQANTLNIADDEIDGTVAQPILGREAKLQALLRLAGERSLELAQTMAVGDGANDLDMIASAGVGVAFRAKPIVAEKAAVSISHGDLTALLYLQGYTREDFIL